jgi:hypothetical protein
VEDWTPKPADPARYNRRLAIIVPYRDRAEHRAIFLPHILTYFQRDKLDRRIPFTLHFIEQSGTSAFNRGKLCNAGYQLARDGADYFCFHDVDYLPLWADYSWSAQPVRLIWHGLAVQENWNTFFGAVILFDKAAFLRANGFSNIYWGWGYEDADLRQRCETAGPLLERRDGTFQALAHPNAGFSPDGTLSADAIATQKVMQEKQKDFAAAMQQDGLSSLSFNLLASQPVSLNGRPVANAFHHLVDIGLPGI